MPTPILLLSNHAEIVGGGEISFLTLLKALDRAKWSPAVIVPDEGAVAGKCRDLGIPILSIPFPTLRRPGPSVCRSIRLICRAIHDTGAHLLHANGSRAMFYAGIAGHIAGRPVIWHIRLLDRDPVLDWVLVRLATCSIAISEAVRDRLRPWPWAHARCKVIPNGLDLSSFLPARDRAELRRSLGLQPTDRVIGTVGRLVPFKGHRYLLEAFAALRRSDPSLVLLLVGDGPERINLEHQAHQLRIAGAVQFLGHREDVPDLLATMEIFVLPSVAEHFGRVLLEAMALRLPIVGTSAGGVPEVVKANVTGLLVPPADATALASAIVLLLADPVRARVMGMAGRRRVEEEYTMTLHAQRVQSLYQEILTSGG